MSPPRDNTIAFEIALFNSDISTMRKLVAADPELFRKVREGNAWVVCDAAKKASPEAIKVLIELGADVNEQDSNGWTGLCWAITDDRYEAAKALLESGADPHVNAAIFHVADENVDDPVVMAKLLLDHGADVNQPYLVEDLPPRTVLSEAVALELDELVDFLKSHGAKLPKDLGAKSETKTKKPAEVIGDATQDVIKHFRKHYGKPEERAVREIVPTSDSPIAIHYIPKSSKLDCAVLFSTGLSLREMRVPKGRERYRRAELMIELDKKWPSPEKAIKDAKWAWPITWMRKVAGYPVANNTWLGAGFTTLVEEEPPQPLAPGLKFTAWLLAALDSDEYIVRCKDGTRIQIYQMFPIYTEEYAYAREQGTEALMSLFMERDIQSYIDLKRPNVAIR